MSNPRTRYQTRSRSIADREFLAFQNHVPLLDVYDPQDRDFDTWLPITTQMQQNLCTGEKHNVPFFRGKKKTGNTLLIYNFSRYCRARKLLKRCRKAVRRLINRQRVLKVWPLALEVLPPSKRQAL